MSEKNSAPSLVERFGEEPRFSSSDVDFGGESGLPPPPQLTPEQEQKLWRKIDMRLLPILSLMYLLLWIEVRPAVHGLQRQLTDDLVGNIGTHSFDDDRP